MEDVCSCLTSAHLLLHALESSLKLLNLLYLAVLSSLAKSLFFPLLIKLDLGPSTLGAWLEQVGRSAFALCTNTRVSGWESQVAHLQLT